MRSGSRGRGQDTKTGGKPGGHVATAACGRSAGVVAPVAAARPELDRAARSMGRARGRARTADALAAGRVRARHRALFCRRTGAGAVGGRRPRAWHCGRLCPGAPAAGRIPAHARRIRDRGGRIHRDAAHRRDQPSGAALRRLRRIAHRLCRDTRGARAHRSHRRPGVVDRRAAARSAARAGTAVGAQGHGAAGRQLRGHESAAQPAAQAAAPGRLRLRPRSLFPAHRRDRVRHRHDQDRDAAGG
jgi:hypothetical protein